MSGQLFPGAGVAARARRTARARTPEDAIARAAFDLTRVVYQPTDFVAAAAQPDSGPYQSYEYVAGDDDRRPRFERPVRVKDVMFPLGDGAVRAGLLPGALGRRASPPSATSSTRWTSRRPVPQEPDLARHVHAIGSTTRVMPCSAPRTARTRDPHPTGMPERLPGRDDRGEADRDREPARRATPGCRPAQDHAGNNCIAYADLKAPDGFGAGDVRGKVSAPGVFDYTYDHAKAADRGQQSAEQPRGHVLPRQLAARPLVRGRVRRGVRQRAAGQLRAAAASAATRSWPRGTTSAAPTTPTCPRRPTAPARACRCSVRRAAAQCPTAPATTRR